MNFSSHGWEESGGTESGWLQHFRYKHITSNRTPAAPITEQGLVRQHRVRSGPQNDFAEIILDTFQGCLAVRLKAQHDHGHGIG